MIELNEPRIVAFTCNWCAYAGADYAGVSRISYPPNVRLIRVMCSGRVEPSFILRALEKGADGVLVGGCHEADCHYVSGNKKAIEKVEEAKKLLDLLGLGEERVRVKWINANEGEAFANEIKDFTETLKKLGPSPISLKKEEESPKKSLEQIAGETDALLCVECGKCTASCPVSRRKPDFSPRLVVEELLEKLYPQIETSKELWDCLTCKTCEERCPYGVRFSEFVKEARRDIKELSNDGNPTRSGQIFSWMRIMSQDGLDQKRLQWAEGLGYKEASSSADDWLFFVGCLPHFEVSHSPIEATPLSIARNSISILNKMGIDPVLLPDERCCGHDLLFAGEADTFKKLANKNGQAFKEAGVKRIVTACPEGYYTLAKEYPKVVDGWDIEVKHITEVVAGALDSGSIELDGDLLKETKVTFQDPCRLGRYMGVYEAPRKLLDAMGADIEEMEHYGSGSICCGVSSWVNCGMTAKNIQLERLGEAKRTGASMLITACPKCQIHFKCALHGRLPGDRENFELPIEDITSLVARALGGGEND